ncbi:MAG: hypothetical protein A2535_00555 [Burkholderiales bacterium RIFOXYD2_FULL_59_8]|nr:MAG: hypothetical protein A2535_00555 [Burkholderiales bacterium RIFOXYD2_FULL_59_8]
MNNLSSKIAKTIASAVVTAAALSGNVMAAGCASAKCGPKQSMSKCGACKAKCGACKAKCGACAAKS